MRHQKSIYGALFLGLTFTFLLLAACGGESTTNGTSTGVKGNKKTNTTKQGEMPKLNEGIWRGILHLTDEQELPFNFELRWNNGKCEVDIINAEERIKVREISYNGEEVIMKMPVFNSEIRCKVNEKRMHGAWHNYAKGPDYKIDFYAVHGDKNRFFEPTTSINYVLVDGKWEVVFMTEDKKSKTDAIGEFKQDKGYLTGTFLTPTGDYRYLEGIANDTMIMLSCFDGAHAFLFKANVKEFGFNDGFMKGEFWSGNHWHEIFLGYPADKNTTLPDPESMTQMQKGKNEMSFSFPNTDGEKISLADKKYEDKVVMVQVLGTWCPNCMDETALYVDLHQQYQSKGLEIVGLAYESSDDLAKTKPILERYKKHFGINYEVLLAGKASKKVASETLPMLTEIKSFPTTIFIDRKGKVRKIHTGFSGPATSKYEAYVEELHAFIKELLGEQS